MCQDFQSFENRWKFFTLKCFIWDLSICYTNPHSECTGNIKYNCPIKNGSQDFNSPFRNIFDLFLTPTDPYHTTPTHTSFVCQRVSSFQIFPPLTKFWKIWLYLIIIKYYLCLEQEQPHISHWVTPFCQTQGQPLFICHTQILTDLTKCSFPQHFNLNPSEGW